MEVVVYGPLRGATGAKTVHVDVDGDTVGAALDALVATHPRVEHHLYRADGSLAPSVRVSVDGERADPEDPCPRDATLSIHPAMRGG